MAEVPFRSLRLFAVLLSLWLAGCAGLLPQPQAGPSRFDLGPLPEPGQSDRGVAGIGLQRLSAASWLNVEQIPYRQLHRRPQALQHYAAHAWIAPPAEMIEVRLQQMLAAEGDASERWRLEVDVLSFEQVFTSASEAQASIMLRATLRQRGGDSVQQRSFSATAPVSADVDGAIDGLPKVADRALRELVAWAADITTSSRPPCPPDVHRESC